MYSKDYFRFGVDWLNVRLSVEPDYYEQFLSDVCQIFMIESDRIESRPSGGVCFYDYADYIPEVGYSSIVFAYNKDEHGKLKNHADSPREVYGLLLSISGDGCRWINSRGNGVFKIFLDYISQFSPHCSRIDMACDILDKNNSVVPLCQVFGYTWFNRSSGIDMNCNMVRRPEFVTLNSVFDSLVNDYTTNVTIGGRSSKKGTLQLYNKRVEIENRFEPAIANVLKDNIGCTDYWWRLEYRAKSFADKVFKVLLTSGLYPAFLFCMGQFGDFVNVKYEGTNQAEMNEDWKEFIDFVESFVDSDIIDFVEFTSTPYVHTSIKKTMSWAEMNASLVYRIMQLSVIAPDWFREMQKKGKTSVYDNSRYRSYLADLEDSISQSEFPEVNRMIFSPEISSVFSIKPIRSV